MKLDSHELPHIIVSACLEVHKEIGPHLVREAYLECLAQELKMREVMFERNVPAEINYKGRRVTKAFRFDFIVEGLIALDILTFPEGDMVIKDQHKERLSTFLRLSGYEIGMFINFRAIHLRNGIKRIIVSKEEPVVRYR